MLIPMSTGLVGGSGGGIEYVGGYYISEPNTSRSAYQLNFDGNLTGGTSSNVAEGDLVLAAVAFNNSTNRDIQADAGWTEVADLYANDTSDVQLGLFARLVPSGGISNVNFSWGASTSFGRSGAMVFRGVDQVTPYGTPATLAQTNTGWPNPPSITKTPSSLGFCVGAGVVGAGAVGLFTSGQTVTLGEGEVIGSESITLTMAYSNDPSATYDPPEMFNETSGSPFDSSFYSAASVSLEIKEG